MGDKGCWAASSCFETVASNCSKKQSPFLVLCSRSVALSVPVNLLLLPQTGKPKELSGWDWCCVLEHSHNSAALELGCFQPALLCQVLLIQEMWWEFFHWEGEALLLSPSSVSWPHLEPLQPLL